MKSAGLVIFIIGIIAAVYMTVHTSGLNKTFQEETFRNLWAEDIKSLESSGKLPVGWDDLNSVEVTVTSPTLKPWLDHYKPDFNVKPTGKFKLQVFLDDFQEANSTGVMIQYHLIDLKSSDTVWEFGRTLML